MVHRKYDEQLRVMFEEEEGQGRFVSDTIWQYKINDIQIHYFCLLWAFDSHGIHEFVHRESNALVLGRRMITRFASKIELE